MFVHHPRINQAARYVRTPWGVRRADEKTATGTPVGLAAPANSASLGSPRTWTRTPPYRWRWCGSARPDRAARRCPSLRRPSMRWWEAARRPASPYTASGSMPAPPRPRAPPSAGENWRSTRARPRAPWSRHGDARVCYAPGSFLQANTESVQRVARRCGGTSRRGVVPSSSPRRWAIGLSLARPRLRTIPFPSGAWRSWRRRGRRSISPRARRSGMAPRGTRVWRTSRSVVAAAARRTAAEAVRGADAVVVDPPRQGLDARTLAALAGHDPAFTNVYGRSGKPLEASERTRGTAGSRARRGLDAKSETNATAALRRNVT